MTDTEFTLKSNIQQYRIAKGLSRPQLAEKVGASWETIKAYEVKGTLPSLRMLYKLSMVLECDIADLHTLEK